MSTRFQVITSALLLLLCQLHAYAAVSGESFTREYFNSRVDKGRAFFAVAPPVKPDADTTLFVYLHSFETNCTEPFAMPPDKPIAKAIAAQYPSAAFLSCHTGASAWDSDAALSDISENIKQVCGQYMVSKIVLIGTSMGACTALVYAAIAPEHIKQRIVGVVSAEGAADLQALYDATSSAQVKQSLSDTLGGTPKEVPANYRRKSFLRSMPLLDRKTKFFIITAKQDSTVPNTLQKELVAALKNRDIPNRTAEVIAGHGIPPASIFVEAVKYILEEKN